MQLDGRVTELADESVTDTYLDWQQRVISPRQPPQQVRHPPTSPSTFSEPASDDHTASHQLVVVPASSRRQTDLGPALIADWLLTARLIHGLLSSCAVKLNNN